MKFITFTLACLANTGYAQDSFEVCIDYHCETTEQVLITADERQSIVGIINQSASGPAAERARIRQAIGRMEKIIGSYTQTHKDLPENEGEDEIGQLDCISESTNSRQYLLWLQQQRLLKWHTIDERVVRSPHFFDVHWGVKITDKSDQTQYVLDSWYGANGDQPSIQPLSQWIKKKTVDRPHRR